MARSSKKILEDFSTPLEEYIPLKMVAVGSPKWLNQAFEAGALFEDEKLYIYDPIEDLKVIKQFLRNTPIRAIDTETTGPHPDDDKNYNMNPLNEDTEMIVFQVGDEEIVYLIEPALLPYLKEELEDEAYVNILHNSFYDWRWLFVKYDIHLVGMFCTMLAEQVLTSGRTGLKVSLQDCSRRYYPYFLISKAVRSMFINYQGFMTREMAYYGARDCVLLFNLRKGQIEALEAYNLMNTAQLEFDIVPCTAELELDGITLDTERLNIIISYWLKREVEASAEILELYNTELTSQDKQTEFLIPGLKDAFDLNSNKAKLEALKALGFELEDVKRETLKEVDYKLAQLLAEYTSITKKTSTYGQNILDKVNKFTGKWHPKFNQLGSGDMELKKGKETKDTIATGRYSGDGQQFPKPVDLYCLASPEEKIFVMERFKDEMERLSKAA